MKGTEKKREEQAFDAFVIAVHDVSGPRADDELLSRIQQSRRDGVRVLLPRGEMPIFVALPERRRWIWGVAAAAALVIVPTTWIALSSVRGTLSRESSATPREGSASTASRTGDTNSAGGLASDSNRKSDPATSTLSQFLLPWPQVAYAQSPGVKREAAYAPVVGVNAARLTAGRRTYARSSASDYHTMLPHDVIETETSLTMRRGIPVWRVASTSPGWRLINEHSNGRSWSYDTLWLRASDLRPIERRYHVGDFMQVVQRFTDSTLNETDSVFARRKGNVRSRSMPQPPVSSSRLDTARIFVHTETAMRLLLRSLPLTSGWRGSVSVPGPSESRVMLLGTAPQYLNLRVAGVDTVQTYSGRIACWRVLLDTGAKPDVWYVSRETGETILTDGAYGPNYPESQLRLLYGFEETKSVAPVRIR